MRKRNTCPRFPVAPTADRVKKLGKSLTIVFAIIPDCFVLVLQILPEDSSILSISPEHNNFRALVQRLESAVLQGWRRILQLN